MKALRRSGGGLPAPRPEALHQELVRCKEENRGLVEAIRILSETDADDRRLARNLYRYGYSNAWIAKILRCTLTEAREMTR